MADLPTERLDYQSYPFMSVRVDYFGPIEVELLRRSMEGWCCLFTCLTTRAIHIEVVGSLDTASCLVAINRFFARRGKPATNISDIGTNFVGSAREVKEYVNYWNKDQITSDLAQKNIVWKFNPPGAPHFGGVWEWLLRICKKAMVSFLGNRSLTDEVLTTTMSLVKRTLNARLIFSAMMILKIWRHLRLNIFVWGVQMFVSLLFPMQKFIQTIARYFDLVKHMQTWFGKDGLENIFHKTMPDLSGTSLKQLLRLEIWFGWVKTMSNDLSTECHE